MKDATQTLTNLSDQAPELTATCPRCDNPQADNFYSPEQETGFIYCSKCGYDAPRDHIYLAPQQEQAVQVPATAPAAGHLSATSPITLSDDAQHQVIPNCPRCGAQYADLVHDPVLKTDFIMCSDCHFKGESPQHLSTETVDK